MKYFYSKNILFSFLLLSLYCNLSAGQKQALSSNIKLDSLQVYSTIVNTGVLKNYVSTNTRGGWDNYAISIGSREDSLPSMAWLMGGYTDNNYLWAGSIWISADRKDIRLYSETCNDFKFKPTNQHTGEPMEVSFSMTDELADSVYYVGAKVICKVYAWMQPLIDDFLIYELFIINGSGQLMEDVYVGLHMDCDVSSAGGGKASTSYGRDDDVDYYIGVDENGNNESISYMFDSDNYNISEDDTGGRFLPKESMGYIGSRILESPVTKWGGEEDKLSGHIWNGWGTWAEYGGTFERQNGAWYMHREEIKGSPPSVHDYRYIQSVGPWDLAANDTLVIAFGIGIGNGLDGLRRNLQFAYDLYRIKDLGPKISSYSPVADTVVTYVGESTDFYIKGRDGVLYRWGFNEYVVSNYESIYSYKAIQKDLGENIVFGTVTDNQYSNSKHWVLIVNPVKKFELLQNYPNPFNGFTTIPFELGKDGNVKITVYDILGSKVKTLINKSLTFGKHKIIWDGTDSNGNAVSSGFYFYQIKSKDYLKAKRLLLLR